MMTSSAMPSSWSKLCSSSVVRSSSFRRGLGVCLVNSPILVPNPAARIIAFIFVWFAPSVGSHGGAFPQTGHYRWASRLVSCDIRMRADSTRNGFLLGEKRPSFLYSLMHTLMSDIIDLPYLFHPLHHIGMRKQLFDQWLDCDVLSFVCYIDDAITHKGVPVLQPEPFSVLVEYQFRPPLHLLLRKRLFVGKEIQQSIALAVPMPVLFNYHKACFFELAF